MRIENSEPYNMPMVVVTEEDKPISPREIIRFAENNEAFKQGNTPTGNNQYLILLPEEFQFDNFKGQESFYTSQELFFDTKS